MTLTPFKNEPFTDFSKPENADRMALAVRKVRDEWLGKEWPLYIDGEEVTTGKWKERFNPCDTSELIGKHAQAGAAEAERAVAAAKAAFPGWAATAPEARARYLLRAAQILRKRKFELSALMTMEEGKTWAEADGDTAEAIDFLDFYARQMMEIAKPHPTTQWPGEENEVQWIPMGPVLVIPPWNFPLAILVGMTTAAMVCGNTIVLKPSSLGPTVAAVFVDIMRELDLPKGVLNLVPGSSRDIGDLLVDHPEIRMITFTGSAAVGCRIYERAGKVQEGQRWLKRVVAEMGGKDAILVDDECDLDAAAQGIVAAAFGFQGQKCSACSRVIAHEAIHDELVEKVVALASEIRVGPGDRADSQMAAVIDEAAYKSILEYIEIGKKEGTLLLGGEPAKVEGKEGWYIKPTIFKDIKPEARVHCEEIFGPVLAILKCKDFSEGLDIVNSSVYALTGAVFSNRREHLERARREFHCGNLYLNRKCTGALVDVQPFGGFNMSGTDDKAGGREHLYRFLQAKTICERL